MHIIYSQLKNISIFYFNTYGSNEEKDICLLNRTGKGFGYDKSSGSEYRYDYNNGNGCGDGNACCDGSLNWISNGNGEFMYHYFIIDEK